MNTNTISGTIFNTQKFSIHDGIGIRTLIFMKGCPLRCLWCSNPESQNTGIQIMDVKSNCIKCGKCAVLCDAGAIDSNTLNIDRKLCRICGRCADSCFANAKKITGRTVSIDDVMDIIEKDMIFYQNSGGGVTVGGGEPVMQAGFVSALLKECKGVNIHTAVETCGFGTWKSLSSILEYTDQVFYDLKAMDPSLHMKLTGVDNHVILDNAAKAARLGKKMTFRIPLVPNCNDSRINITETGNFIQELSQINRNISVELLAYHDLGKDKYRWLDMNYALHSTGRPDAASLQECKNILLAMELNVI